MKKLTSPLTLTLIILFVTPMVIYFWKFGSSMSFGSKEDFANFGSYIGGTVGFSTLALLVWFNVKQIDALINQQSQTKKLFDSEVAYRTLNTATNDLESLLKQPFKYFCHNDIEWLGMRLRHENSFHELIQDHMLFEDSLIKNNFQKNISNIMDRPFFTHLNSIIEKIYDVQMLVSDFRNHSEYDLVANYHSKNIKNIISKLEKFGFIDKNKHAKLFDDALLH